MENFKPIKYFIANKITTLSDRQLRRNCEKAYLNGETYVVKVEKNKNKISNWLINISSIEIIGSRKRKPKQKKKPESYYNVEVSINFNDRSDYAYYSEIIRLFRFYTNYDLVYKIESSGDFKNCYHLHIGVHGTYKIVKKYIDFITNHHLQRKCNKYYDKRSGEHKSSIRVRKLVDEDAFIDYISKGYDRLGGDSPTYVFF